MSSKGTALCDLLSTSADMRFDKIDNTVSQRLAHPPYSGVFRLYREFVVLTRKGLATCIPS